jgi:hypothetical protein
MCVCWMSPLHVRELPLVYIVRFILPTMPQRTEHIFCGLCACSVLCGIVWEFCTVTFYRIAIELVACEVLSVVIVGHLGVGF